MTLDTPKVVTLFCHFFFFLVYLFGWVGLFWFAGFLIFLSFIVDLGVYFWFWDSLSIIKSWLVSLPNSRWPRAHRNLPAYVSHMPGLTHCTTTPRHSYNFFLSRNMCPLDWLMRRHQVLWCLSYFLPHEAVLCLLCLCCWMCLFELGTFSKFKLSTPLLLMSPIISFFLYVTGSMWCVTEQKELWASKE